MTTVFISYRREETAGEARALFGALVSRLGDDSVFMDVDNIGLGRDFRQVLQERLASCDLLLALIGREWVNAKNSSGQRRLDDPADFVRLEIETALKRNIPVTPVLLQGAQMPSVQQLPEALKDFAYRNGFELSHTRWESDVREMVKRLGLGKERETAPVVERGAPAERTPAAPGPARNPWFAIAGTVAAVIAIGGGGLIYYKLDSGEEARAAAAEAQAAKAKADAEAERAKAAIAKAQAGGDSERAKAAAAQARADAEAAQAKAAAEQAEKERAAAARADRERAAAAAQKDRPVAAAPVPTAPAPAVYVKIDKATCTDLGGARYLLNLWGSAGGDVGSVLWGGPNIPPNTGTVDETKFSCVVWGRAQPEDVSFYARACKRAPGNGGSTLWSSQTTFQWRGAEPPRNAFVALRPPRAPGSADSTKGDKATFMPFNCSKS